MIIVMYAHKGGTGRSAAVANLAPVLSTAGYRVLTVDFDLEAPGLHRYFQLQDADCQTGVVDLVEQWREQLNAAEPRGPTLPELLEPRFAPTRLISGEEMGAQAIRERVLGPTVIGRQTPMEAWVKLLPAGRLDGRYRARAAGIDWAAMYREPDWRAFFGWFKRTLTDTADAVLIDARAGVTDMGALCLFALADRVIFLTPPTHQGLDGVLDTARQLRASGSNAKALLVVSRVSADADREHLGRWLHAAREKVSAADLLPLWLDVRTADDARAMVDRWILPEVPVHAVGEPLVRLRMLERGIVADNLAEAYARLGGELRRWIAVSSRETARLQELSTVELVKMRIAEAQRHKDVEALAGLWARLAEVLLERYPDRARVDEARAACERGKPLAEALGLSALGAHFVHLLGWCAHEDGDYDTAVGLYEQAEQALERLNEGRDEQVALLRRRGDAECARGRWEEAKRLLNAALVRIEAGEAPAERGWVLRGLAWLSAYRGDPAEAAEHWSRAATYWPDDLLGREERARDLSNAAIRHHLAGDSEGRERALNALDTVLTQDRPPNPMVLAALHGALAKVGPSEEAILHYRRRLDHLTVGAPTHAMAIGNVLTDIGLRVEEPEAIRLLEQAVARFEARRQPDWNELGWPVAELLDQSLSANNLEVARAHAERLAAAIVAGHVKRQDTLARVAEVLLEFCFALTPEDQNVKRLLHVALQAAQASALTSAYDHASLRWALATISTTADEALPLLEEAERVVPVEQWALRALLLDQRARWSPPSVATQLKAQAAAFKAKANAKTT